MLSNKWMLVCTLIGAIITVAMISSIPIYTNGILQRMLIKEFDNAITDTGKYPFSYSVEFNGMLNSGDNTKTFEKYNNIITNKVFTDIGLPAKSQYTYLSHGSSMVMDTKAFNYGGVMDVSAMSKIEDNITIVNGRLYSNKKTSDNAYEVIATQEAMKSLNLALGGTYNLTEQYTKTGSEPVSSKIKVVGIFKPKDNKNAYWNKEITEYKNIVFMNYDLFKSDYANQSNVGIYKAVWYIAYNYGNLSVNQANNINDIFKDQQKWFMSNFRYLKFVFMGSDILTQYSEKAKTLSSTLLVLQIPILLILAFYCFMISKMKIDFESNEIAVIKSRGGNSLFVFSIYLIESLIISIAALLVGPLIGFFICRIMGASNGFLEFVQRAALNISINPKAYLYSLVAVLIISISMLIPAFQASRVDIVQYKQKKSKITKNFWQKIYLDIILLALSLYGLFSYQRQQKILFVSGVKGTDISIDPLLYIISVTFVFGAGLLILRLFPYLVKLIYMIGENKWNPILYSTFVSVSKSTGKDQFAMIFIILTLSIGLFSASSARTINLNMEQKIKYQIGSDMVVQTNFKDNKPVKLANFGPPTEEDIKDKLKPLVYYEPVDYNRMTEIKDIVSMTKVLKVDDVKTVANLKEVENVQFMAIKPNEFGKTATFDTSLLPHHWYNYLNLMTDAPNAVLVSSAYKRDFKVKEGDTITISYGTRKNLNCIIYAFVDYWPSLNPNRKVGNNIAPYFVVANLNYVQNIRSLEPYQIWIKKNPEVSNKAIYNAMADKKIELKMCQDMNEQLVKKKNDPFLEGTNGSLSFGFLITIIICIIGFLTYWLMSIKKRVLQFGIFRAMGLTLKNIIQMIACEQLMVTGSSVLGGILIGGLASKIFVPMLQVVYSSEEQVPPFKVIAYLSDYTRLFVIFTLMLIICFVVLSRFVKKINIGQALKLGED